MRPRPINLVITKTTVTRGEEEDKTIPKTGREMQDRSDRLPASLVYSNLEFKLLKSIRVGRAPAGVVSGKNGLIYVANRDDNTISVISEKSFEIVETFKVGDHPFGLGLNPLEDKLLVTNVKSHDVSIINLDKKNEIFRVQVGKRPYCISFSSSGLLAYVTNQYEDTVSVIDINKNEVIKTVSVGSFPEGIDSNNDYIFVTNWMDEEMMILDAKTYNVVQSIELGSNPRNFGRFLLTK